MSRVSPEERPGGTTGLAEGDIRVNRNPTEEQTDTTGTADINPRIKEAVFGKEAVDQDLPSAEAVPPQEMAEFASPYDAPAMVVDPDTGGKMPSGAPLTDEPVNPVAVTERGR